MDLFHAREHVHDLARRLEFMLGDQKEHWLAARLEDLDYGYINGIVALPPASTPLTGVKKDEIDTALGYFEHNALRMRYHWFRQCGLFVGSGLVEAGCKSVIGHRLKRAGMHWTVNGADAIAALRCQQASRPEDQIWPVRRPTRRKPPDQPRPLNDLGHLQKLRAPDDPACRRPRHGIQAQDALSPMPSSCS